MFQGEYILIALFSWQINLKDTQQKVLHQRRYANQTLFLGLQAALL